jgi:isopentenyl-diphosphate delta-isomerase
MSVARRLLDVGVRIIDVAGAGGTSWAGVEILRRGNVRKERSRERGGQSSSATAFWDWGIPTVDALRQVSSLKTENASLTLISSGGISGGLDIAKSIAFGADLAAAARTFLRILKSSGGKGLLEELEGWETELRGAMFLTGSRTIPELQDQRLVLKA